MSLLRGLLRFSLRPAMRVGEQLKESSGRLRQLRLQHEQRLAERLEAAKNNGQEDPSERFERMCEEGGWTEESLSDQLVAVRRTKMAALVGACIGAVGGVVALLVSPLWILLLLVPAVAGLTALAIVSALKFGLYQAQLEQRRLIGLRDYLCRPDLMAHLLGRGASK